MPSIMLSPVMTHLYGVVLLPPNRGPFSLGGFNALSQQSLPTDPIGVFTLTFTHVIPGSRLYIEDQDGVQVFYNADVVASDVTVNLQAYAPGSTLNALRIKFRKGSSAPYYQSWETLTTAIIGSQSIYVAQIPDE